jgi:hypothetical protein
MNCTRSPTKMSLTEVKWPSVVRTRVEAGLNGRFHVLATVSTVYVLPVSVLKVSTNYLFPFFHLPRLLPLVRPAPRYLQRVSALTHTSPVFPQAHRRRGAGVLSDIYLHC